MNLYVAIKHTYGERRVYPACETSRTLAKLAGLKTFTPVAIELVKSLGYTFNVEQETV